MPLPAAITRSGPEHIETGVHRTMNAIDSLRQTARRHMAGAATGSEMVTELRLFTARTLTANEVNWLARRLADTKDGQPPASEERTRSEAPPRAAPGTEITAVYTDGCAIPNPGAGGWAVVAIGNGRVVSERQGHAGHTTNNRMEMQALIEAFRMLPTGTEAEVFSDSQLSVRTLTEWAPAWRRAGWRRSRGGIANLDLVREALELFEERPKCRVRWIRGHAGHRWNERADELANAAANQKPRGTNRHDAISE